MRILKGLAIRLANKVSGVKPAPAVTTDSILADIRVKVDQLHDQADKKLAEQSSTMSQINDLLSKASAAGEEASRAVRVASRFEELLA